MPLGCNDPTIQLNSPFRSLQQNARCSFRISGEANRRLDPQASAVCQGDLHLPFLSFRSQHSHILKPSFGTDDRYTLLRKELPRLRKGAFFCQAMSEQCVCLVPGQMDMAPGCLQLHEELFCDPIC